MQMLCVVRQKEKHVNSRKTILLALWKVLLYQKQGKFLTVN